MAKNKTNGKRANILKKCTQDSTVNGPLGIIIIAVGINYMVRTFVNLYMF